MELWGRARRAVETESADWVEKPRLVAISEQALRMGASSSTTRTRRAGAVGVGAARDGVGWVVLGPGDGGGRRGWGLRAGGWKRRDGLG